VKESAEEPLVDLHYLGHASFLLTFGPGSRDAITVLTDFGESRAYGLDSPIHPIGDFTPDVVTVSHDHADPAGGELPPGSFTILRGDEAFERGDLTITPIPTYEGSLEAPDNVSFLFSYEGLKILHLGDCQGLMTGLAGEKPEKEETVRLMRTGYPDHYDLVFLPIGFFRSILEEAAEFMTYLDTRTVVPMHFWSTEDRDTFMALVQGATDKQGREYRVQGPGASNLDLFRKANPNSAVTVVGLTPAPSC
jgi:L-ascorbate metabolism protein UlaG (beta-lactamase superfamily)